MWTNDDYQQLYKSIQKHGSNHEKIAKLKAFHSRSRESIKKAIKRIKNNELPNDVEPPPTKVIEILTQSWTNEDYKILYDKIILHGNNERLISEAKELKEKTRTSITKAIKRIKTNSLTQDIDRPPQEVLKILRKTFDFKNAKKIDIHEKILQAHLKHGNNIRKICQ